MTRAVGGNVVLAERRLRHPRRTHLPLWLWAVAGTAFVMYTNDYIIAGVLPEMSDDVSVTAGQGGQLVTVFSLMLAVSARASRSGSPRRGR